MTQTPSLEQRFFLRGGLWDHGHPIIPSGVAKTPAGTRYLTEPGIALIAKPAVNLKAVAEFLRGFDGEGFEGYLDDPDKLTPGTELAKYSGQICYMAVGEKRSKNDEAEKYFDNIFAQDHTSILEHAYFVFQIWGVDRSFTHELVRHRVGVSYSQVSQRYVGGNVLRFVERAERQSDADLHKEFIEEIDRSARGYEDRCDYLLEPKNLEKFGWDKLPPRDRRKAVRQLARDMLPNCTEAPIVFGVNVRQLRHMIGLRGNRHADLPIREVTLGLFLCIAQLEPLLFQDIEISDEVTPAELKRR